MENRANYAAVGIITLVILVLSAVLVLWLSDSQFDAEFHEYDVVFDDPVRGLRESSDIHFNGIRVGEVTDLRFDPDNSNRVIARIRVNADTPIDTQATARLEPQGLTGLAYIQITSGGPEFPLLHDGGGDVPVIQANSSLFDQFASDGAEVIQRANATLEETRLAMTRFNATFDEETIGDLKDIISNVSRITGGLAEDESLLEQVSRTLSAIEQAAINVDKAAVRVDDTAKLVEAWMQTSEPEVTAAVLDALEQTNELLSDSKVLISDAQDVTGTAKRTLEQFNEKSLYDLEQALAELNRLLETASRIAEELERNPRRVIAGEEREVMELPQ